MELLPQHVVRPCEMRGKKRKMFFIFYLPLLTVGVNMAASEKTHQSVSGYNKTLCKEFETGNPEKMELYSPNYPANYPNGTDCFALIQAPVGHLVRLDFRDSFHLEPSDSCQYDFLEVRDGGHGYSSLVGKYCGRQFPPMITSTTSSLWLRFHSDESIEHSGFRAVYAFIPRPTSESSIPEMGACRMEVSGVEGFINSSDVAREHSTLVRDYGLPLDCVWVIKVEPGWRIQLNFSRFQLKVPNDCESNFVDVFGERTDLPSRLHNFCGSMAELVLSPNSVLQLRLFLMPSSIDSYFEALFTAFRVKPKDGSCEDQGLYDCEDGFCINVHLKCNGRVNCRLRWDEEQCKEKPNIISKIVDTEHLLIILVVFFLILTGMCGAFLFNCCRRLIRDHRINKEEKRMRRGEKWAKEAGRKGPGGGGGGGGAVFPKGECFVPDSGGGGELVLVPIKPRSEESPPLSGDASPVGFTTFGYPCPPPPAPPPPPAERPALAPDVIKTH